MTPGVPQRVRVVGRGRAGGAFARALSEVGLEVDVVSGRGSLSGAATGVDLVLLCVPDAHVATVAAAIDPTEAVVAHVAGSLGLDVLAPHHRRRGSIHPLAALPDAEVGSARLLAGAAFAVDGPGGVLDVLRGVVSLLGGRSFEVPDDRRAAYHAAACIASNHLVGLMGQVERVAAGAGVPFDAFVDLVRGTVDNVAVLGPAGALTGPAARGDDQTLELHRSVLDPSERPAYDAMVELCRRLASTWRA